MRFLFVICFIFLDISACKLFRLGGSDKDQMLDGETLPDMPATETDELTAVPSSLWSPFQRKSNAGYYFLTSEYMLLGGNPKKAVPLLEAAYALDPNPFLGGRLVAAKAASGGEGEALLDIRKMVLLYPKSANLRFLFGQLLLNLSDSQEDAEKQLEKSIELDPTLEAGYLVLIDLHQRDKKFDKAIVISKDLVKALPKSIAGWTILSRLYLVTRDKKKALEPARRAYQMQSSNPELVLVYALTLELNGKSKEAVHLYEQLYRLDPSNEELIGRMVALYRDLGDLKDALNLLDELNNSSKTTKIGVEMQRAFILWELKRFKEASSILDRLATEYPDSDRLHYMSALGQEKLEQYEKALEIYKNIPENSQFKIHAQVRSAGILQHLKRYNDATAIIETLLEDNSQNADLYVMAASVYSDQEKYANSIEIVTVALSKFPDQRPRFLFLKGVYQEKAQDRDGCIKTIQEVIKIAPNNPDALNYLGYLYAEAAENLEEAESLIKRALKLRPDNGFYLDSLAWVYYQRKEYLKALPLLEQALKREPEEGVVMEHLGDVHKALGHDDKVRKLYEAALKCKLEKRDRVRIEEKTKKLK